MCVGRSGNGARATGAGELWEYCTLAHTVPVRAGHGAEKRYVGYSASNSNMIGLAISPITLIGYYGDDGLGWIAHEIWWYENLHPVLLNKASVLWVGAGD